MPRSTRGPGHETSLPRRRTAVQVAVVVAALLVLPLGIRALSGGSGSRDASPAQLAAEPDRPVAGAVGGASANTAGYDGNTGRLSFDLPAFAGGRVTSANLQGHPAVLNFYASWCEVCHRELPAFQAVSHALGSRVVFVGVNPQARDNDAQQAAMIAEAGVSYATVRDHDEHLLRPFDSSGSLPVTLLLRPDGTVADVHLGGLTQPALAALITAQLGVSA